MSERPVRMLIKDAADLLQAISTEMDKVANTNMDLEGVMMDLVESLNIADGHHRQPNERYFANHQELIEYGGTWAYRIRSGYFDKKPIAETSEPEPIAESKPNKELMTIEDVSEALGVSIGVVYRLVVNSEIDSFKIGRRIMFKREFINDYLVARYAPAKRRDK